MIFRLPKHSRSRKRRPIYIYICPLSLFYWHLVPSFIREHSKVRGTDGRNSEAPRRIDKYLTIDKYTTWERTKAPREAPLSSVYGAFHRYFQPCYRSRARAGNRKKGRGRKRPRERNLVSRSEAARLSRSCRETRPPLLLRQTLKYSEEQELLNSNKYLSSSVFQLI